MDQGQCRTVNFCEKKKFFESEVDDKRFYESHSWVVRTPENETQPFVTTSPERGLDASILYFDYRNDMRPKDKSSFILMIHSPLELPTESNQKFHLNDLDYDTFFVTPQLNTIDDTMIAMKPQE